ncbi:MAG TPA: hypothetical protein VJ836_05330 [Candidatus Saccharimonadales bacterium]|nr:hypothetical protein [Candidatus Saccharimonadales bacterium]
MSSISPDARNGIANPEQLDLLFDSGVKLATTFGKLENPEQVFDSNNRPAVGSEAGYAVSAESNRLRRLGKWAREEADKLYLGEELEIIAIGLVVPAEEQALSGTLALPAGNLYYRPLLCAFLFDQQTPGWRNKIQYVLPGSGASAPRAAEPVMEQTALEPFGYDLLRQLLDEPLQITEPIGRTACNALIDIVDAWGSYLARRQRRSEHRQHRRR